MNEHEKRANPRADLNLFVFLRSEAGEAVGEVRNVSLDGLFVKTAKHLQPGTSVHVTLQGQNGQNVISFQGNIIRRDEALGGVGIHIEEISTEAHHRWCAVVSRAQEAGHPTGSSINREAS